MKDRWMYRFSYLTGWAGQRLCLLGFVKAGVRLTTWADKIADQAEWNFFWETMKKSKGFWRSHL